MLRERTRGRRGLMRATGTRCGIIGTRLRHREDKEPGNTRQKDLTERFSRNKYLEKLHKHQKGEKKRENIDFHSTQFWIRENSRVQRKAEEDIEASSIAMLDDLQLMAIVAGGVSQGCLYGAGLEAAHFINESSRAAIGLSCCLDNEQWLMRRVEDVVSRVSATFHENMRG
ncbi:hypothetical protein M9H77_25918 [Catharanthus roseus]|uniref:Uncharacterized protein n=1 Tax=Catharanthus roseus TaxID=4058 RepID=A0ACC0AA29_CATRO|nr:hypothetical protein M9H77_25918 [Catharanthus roseus]